MEILIEFWNDCSGFIIGVITGAITGVSCTVIILLNIGNYGNK